MPTYNMNIKNPTYDMNKRLEIFSIYRSSVNIQVSEEVPQPGPSSGAVPKQPLPRLPAVPPPPRRTPPVINQLPTGPRLQAFAVSTPTKPSGGGGGGGVSANKTTKQLETRQRQLEMLRRMEER